MFNQSTNHLWCTALCTKLTFLAAMAATAVTIVTKVTAVTRSCSYKECNRCLKSNKVVTAPPKNKSQLQALFGAHHDVCLHDISCSSTTISELQLLQQQKLAAWHSSYNTAATNNQLLQGSNSRSCFRSGPTEYKSFSTYTAAAGADT